ncbi:MULTISPECIES: hypothetical protein [Xanthomonas]|uniref:Uncharacterized protein n=1 Tax=Xanthomonas dyei TaxID=743699 RepID=A0ABZ0D3B5_9XANT|nr:hypothetical protein [Xanthomonas dyei]WOB24763.1 hypothetical protein NYR99_13235 [Xanthomonas dyei]WOB52391.1 hypothetical protein NYR95_13240 [Xanthomonas dyei]
MTIQQSAKTIPLGEQSVGKMTKCERIASEQMAGILANSTYDPPRREKLDLMARDAVAAAHALLAALSHGTQDQYKAAYEEWMDKTEWVQKSATYKELGMHRADVLRVRIEALQGELRALGGTLTACEISSQYTRVKWAEDLIRQLPEEHDGRNSWLLNYSAKLEPQA